MSSLRLCPHVLIILAVRAEGPIVADKGLEGLDSSLRVPMSTMPAHEGGLAPAADEDLLRLIRQRRLLPAGQHVRAGRRQARLQVGRRQQPRVAGTPGHPARNRSSIYQPACQWTDRSLETLSSRDLRPTGRREWQATPGVSRRLVKSTGVRAKSG